MTKFELGCYGDGTFGHQHTRNCCAQLLKKAASGLSSPTALADAWVWQQELTGEMSDDASEEADACDWLNTYAAVHGARWGWQDGDFGLWPVEGGSA